MFPCTSGKHYWTHADDAQKCCNGYVRILVLGGGENAQLIEGVVAGRAWVKQEAVIPQQGHGADPNCRNCEGAGGAFDDGSCGQCWSEIDADTTVVIVLSEVAVRQCMGATDPDRVQHIGQGIYEARWSPGCFEVSQYEVLRATPSITIVAEPFSPEDILGWTAVRFCLNPVMSDSAIRVDGAIVRRPTLLIEPNGSRSMGQRAA